MGPFLHLRFGIHEAKSNGLSDSVHSETAEMYYYPESSAAPCPGVPARA